MDAIAAWLQVYRSAGWFSRPVPGVPLPMPATWQGWLAFLSLILILAICTTTPRAGAPIGTCAFLFYAALAWWTLEKAD
ncbi:MAG: hypothetical protein V4475_03840 [Pseudomonadota bacterium]